MELNHLAILLESIDSKVQVTLEAVSALDRKIDSVRDELKEDIAVVDCKVMGLSKRLDSVEKRLSDEIAEVRADLAEVKVDLAAHRNNTELHHAPPKRPLKRA